jgi:hypothetical protein
VLCCLFRGLADHRHIEAAADNASDVFGCHRRGPLAGKVGPAYGAWGRDQAVRLC